MVAESSLPLAVYYAIRTEGCSEHRMIRELTEGQPGAGLRPVFVFNVDYADLHLVSVVMVVREFFGSCDRVHFTTGFVFRTHVFGHNRWLKRAHWLSVDAKGLAECQLATN